MSMEKQNMEKKEILDVVTQEYDNLMVLSHEEIIKKRNDPKTLGGIREDSIGKATHYLFFIGTKILRRSKRIRAIIEVSKRDAEISVLSFQYI